MTAEEKIIIVEHGNKTVYRQGNEVVKLFRAGHPKSGLFNEAYIHATVEEAGIEVPEILGVRCIDGRWALIQQYIEGQTLEQKMLDHPESFRKYIDRLIEIQLEVINHRAPGLRNTLDKMAERINEIGGLDPSTRYELLQRIHGMERHTKVCHGDFVPSNVMIQKDGRYKVLDWSHATQGNAGADAAITYMRFKLAGEDDHAEYYLRQYCIKSDTAIQYVQKWMPIVAAAQMEKNKPEEKEFLERWVSVAEYN